LFRSHKSSFSLKFELPNYKNKGVIFPKDDTFIYPVNPVILLACFQNLSHRPHTQRKPMSQSLYRIIESQSFYLIQVVKLGNNQAIAEQCICSASFGSLATRR
jgi:hypothetical protein